MSPQCLRNRPTRHAESGRYVKELEDRVAALESQLASTDASHGPKPPQDPAQPPSLAIASPTHTSSPEKDPQSFTKPVGAFDFTIPSESECRVLTEAYFEHSNFFSPFLDPSIVAQQAQKLYGSDIDSLLQQPQATFTLCAVLAVSVCLLHCTDSSAPKRSAERYFAVALSIYNDRNGALRTGDLDELEYLLLIVQYTMFASDLTTCLQHLHSAITLAVSLKLHKHQSTSSSGGVSSSPGLQSEADHHFARGRWLFWTTYNFERNLRSALQMPMVIPDAEIETALPQNDQNDHMCALAIHILRYRQLESSIQSYRMQSIQVGEASHDSPAFRSQLYARLVAWKEQCPPFFKPTRQVSLDIIEGLFEVAVVRLYSIPTQLAYLSKDDTYILLKHAAHAITSYRKSFKGGSLRFYWRTIHNLYLCGSALVHCVKSSAADPATIVDVGEAMRLATICSSVLWGMAERYPAGARLRDSFDDLAESAFHASSRQLITPSAPVHEGISLENRMFQPNLATGLYDFDLDESLYSN